MALEFRTEKWFAFILSVLCLTDLAIVLNIPFLRQIAGFIILSVFPGLLILHIMKVNEIDSVEKFVLSVGLSVSFLMLFGLLLNNSLPVIGYETPLATVSLLVAFNLTLIVLVVIGYYINKYPIFSIPKFKLGTTEKLFLIIPILFPALSIFGAHTMSATNNNIILMFLLLLIPSYVVFVSFFNQKFPKRLYPIIIFLIGISLLFVLPLRSGHIIGVDTHSEYYFFQTALDNQCWGAGGHSTLDACLSISLLPTIYKSILNIHSETLFRILYPLIYSVSPLVIYIISKKYLDEFYAFLAACFFMFQLNFLFTAYNARTNIAILFFALSIMVLFGDKIHQLRQKVLFIIFIISCVVSHYSTTYIFFFILFGAFVGMNILSKKHTFKKNISLTIVLLFFSFIFFWYSQITETAFNAGVNFIGATISNLDQLFIEESRGIAAQTLFGEGILQKSIPHQIEFLFTWITFTLIGIGVITTMRRYKEMLFIEPNFERSYLLKKKFEVGYFIIALICAGLLIVMVVLPYVSKGYNLDRLYAVSITILCTFFVIGGVTASKFLKFRTYMVILFVIIPYFFCVSGVMYNIFGVPHTIILDSEGDQYDKLYVYDQESCSAKWWSEHKGEYQKIYADFYGGKRLMSQGKIPLALINYYWLLVYKDTNVTIRSHIYLRHQNVVGGKLIDARNEIHHITDCQYLFNKKSTIYDAGCSKILR